MEITVFRNASITSVPHTFTGVNGEVVKVAWNAGNTETLGSYYLHTNDTVDGHTVISQLFGSNIVARYPTAEPEDNSGTGIGSTTRLPFAVYGDLVVGASGTGAETAGSNFGVAVYVRK